MRPDYSRHLRNSCCFGLDLHQIAEIWRFGSVVRSRQDAPFSDKLLSAMCGKVGGHAVKRDK